MVAGVNTKGWNYKFRIDNWRMVCLVDDVLTYSSRWKDGDIFLFWGWLQKRNNTVLNLRRTYVPCQDSQIDSHEGQNAILHQYMNGPNIYDEPWYLPTKWTTRHCNKTFSRFQKRISLWLVNMPLKPFFGFWMQSWCVEDAITYSWQLHR